MDRLRDQRALIARAGSAPWILAWITLGLLIDAELRVGQTLVDIVTWAFFTLLLVRGSASRRRAMLSCLVLANLGEVVLSLLWQLYDYRLGNLPLFVPPGHVLLFLCGQQLARHLKARAATTVALAALAVCAPTSVALGDTISLPLLAVFGFACLHRDQRALYATMFVLALAMELWGTALGNWAWKNPAPGIEVGTHNPPLAVGAIYVLLDRLVFWTAGRTPARGAA